MSENISANSVNDAALEERPRAFNAIFYGGLVVGVLDGLAAIISSGLRGVTPTQIFQFIASGLLGRNSYNGGFATVLLGILLHFLIAYIFAAFYYRVSLNFPILIRQAVVCGVIYGIAGYFVMNYLVLPLSLTPKIPFSFTGLLTGVTIHAFCVGLPIALIARRSAQTS